jgi:hypothetical protein
MMRVLVAVGILAALVGFHSHEWLSWRRAFNDFAPRLFK